MTDKMREAFEAWCVAFCDGMLLDDGNQWAKLAALTAWQAATLAERERCALVCESRSGPRGMGAWNILNSAADAIRKGGAT